MRGAYGELGERIEVSRRQRLAVHELEDAERRLAELDREHLYARVRVAGRKRLPLLERRGRELAPPLERRRGCLAVGGEELEAFARTPDRGAVGAGRRD